MINLESLYHPVFHRPMHVAVFGSGSGTILRAILAAQKKSEQLHGRSPFAIKLLFTDRKCRFQQIAQEEKLPLIEHDHSNGPIQRQEYDLKGVEHFFSFVKKENLKIDFVLLAGYMRILGNPWLKVFSNRILNVHPADLTLLDSKGKRQFTGSNSVFQALQEGQKQTRSTVILIDEKIDTGPIIVSGPWVQYQGKYPITKECAAAHQEKQKMFSDWPACFVALQLVSQGRVKLHSETKKVFIDGIEQPSQGYEHSSAFFKYDQRGIVCVESLGLLGKNGFQN